MVKGIFMQDFVIADISVHLAASKNAQYKANTVALFKTLGLFLQHHGLVIHELLHENEEPTPTFKIRRSDLTDEGFVCLKAALHKWVKTVMAGKCAPTDSTILAKELAKIQTGG